MRAERFEMRIVLDPPAPSVCDDDRLDSARMLAREIQAGPAQSVMNSVSSRSSRWLTRAADALVWESE